MTDIDIVDGFDEWLRTGTIRRVDVTLYNDPAIEPDVDRAAAWRDRLDHEDNPDPTELADCEALEAEVTERLEASKSVWTIKALLDEEFDAAAALFPEPRAPILPSRDAHQKTKDRWEKDRDAFLVKAANTEIERRLLLISHAVERVVTIHGERDTITVDDLRRMLEAPYGTYRINVLWDAVIDAHKGDVRVPAPK